MNPIAVSSDTPQTNPLRDMVVGTLVFVALLSAIATHLLADQRFSLIAGVCGWTAALLLWPKLKRQQRIQSLTMLTLGAAALLWASQFQALDWHTALSANKHLIAMLSAVTFLRLVTTHTLDSDQRHPSGPKALNQTLLGVHLFGSVINYSAPMLMAERLTGGQPLKAAQAIVLSRGFAAAAFWSPFFVAMGVALTNAPGAELVSVSLAGLPLAALALLMTRQELAGRRDLAHCEGYPMQTQALKIPALLAVTILVAHELFQNIPVVTLIAITSLTITALLLARREPAKVATHYGRHITTALPAMQSELWLFLSAGVLATGINAVIHSTGFALSISHAGALEISLYLLLACVLALLAIHPVIIIASAGNLLMPLVDSPNLLALAFLMTWVLGVGGSPFSGLNLSMASRFQMNNLDFCRWNMGYSLKLYLLCAAALFVYDWTGWL